MYVFGFQCRSLHIYRSSLEGDKVALRPPITAQSLHDIETVLRLRILHKSAYHPCDQPTSSTTKHYNTVSYQRHATKYVSTPISVSQLPSTMYVGTLPMPLRTDVQTHGGLVVLAAKIARARRQQNWTLSGREVLKIAPLFTTRHRDAMVFSEVRISIVTVICCLRHDRPEIGHRHRHRRHIEDPLSSCFPDAGLRSSDFCLANPSSRSTGFIAAKLDMSMSCVRVDISCV